ncbi:DNA replication protein DnaC [Paenibacillus cellulosilyticus]|uniref:DNA replication protein DnaC n=2 Tax=Paenibacillus cellulosilyticus TaxID=375489 RepID=A0A2V2YYD7_9BACL|nr:ATP-binding protein [Paenibacillus cellulosilyticus]PWW06291.1 DNA replication protein DnaC [Paenibacillus cellulosilyticus]
MLTSTSQVGVAEPEYKCAICKDEEGYIVKDDDDREYWRICECKSIRRVERLMRSSHITDEFRQKRFGNFNHVGRPQVVVDAFEAAREYANVFREIRSSRQNSIALLGRPGCGKTHLLMAIANKLLSSGVGVAYFPWVEGFNDLKSDLDAVAEKVYRLQQAEVLYIDDLFKGRKEVTPFQIEQLFAIINYRYLQHKPLLISSERTVSDMCEIDEGIGSRIYEMSKTYRVTLQGGQELNYRLSGM